MAIDSSIEVLRKTVEEDEPCAAAPAQVVDNRRSTCQMHEATKMGATRLTLTKGRTAVLIGTFLGVAALLWIPVPSQFLRRDIFPGRNGQPRLAESIESLKTPDPLIIKPTIVRFLALSDNDRQWVNRQFQPPTKTHVLNSSYCLHLLRVHGLDDRLESSEISDGRVVLALLTNSDIGQAYFGTPPLITTRSGARFVPMNRHVPLPSMELHRDQTLAAFAELGIPLTFPIRVKGSEYRLDEALRDSLANFDLHQDELPWTTVAYSLYLPPLRSWSNRYGESYSFDDLARALLRTSFTRASCGGTHVLYALTIMLRVNQVRQIVSEETRSAICEWMEKKISLATNHQAADGSWQPGWWKLPSEGAPAQPKPAKQSEVLATTGHVLEWLLYLPSEMRPTQDTFSRGGLWLLFQLHAATAPDQVKDFCSYAHACCVLRWLMTPGSSHNARAEDLRDSSPAPSVGGQPRASGPY